MVFIVVRRDIRDNIIRAIMEKAGLRTKAQAIAFSLPVSSVAGMRLVEADEITEKN